MVRIAIVSIALFSVGALADGAHATEDSQHAQAQKLVEVGLKDARAQRFEAAVKNFDAALKLFPHPEIAHNLARAQEESGHLIAAIDAFKRALDMDATYTFAEEARTRITTLDKTLRETHGVVTVRSTPEEVALTISAGEQLVAGHLTTPVTRYIPAGGLSIKASKAGFLATEHLGEVAAGVDVVVDLVLRPVPKKGFVTITADAEGAEVFIDGQRVGVTPLEGYAIQAGRHALLITVMGRVPYEASFEVTPNAEARVGAVLVSDQVDEAPMGSSLLGGVLLGSGGGAAVIAATLWVFAAKNAAKARDASDDSTYDQIVSNTMAQQAGAWVSAAVALGLIGTGAAFLIMGPGDDAAPDAARWTPLLAPTDGGLGVGAMVRF
jgi:hypothetical protein